MTENQFRPFDVFVPKGKRFRSIKILIPCYWDEELGEWMMTEEGIKMIEAAKFAHGMEKM